MQKWSEQGTIFLNIARLKFNTDGEKFLNFFLPVIGTYIRPLSQNEYHATPAETRGLGFAVSTERLPHLVH